MQKIRAEIVTIGDEILYGHITDTNSRWLANALSLLGITVVRTTSIGDTKEEIISILDETLKRSDIVLLTGGLGPTKDDVTKNTLCDYTHDFLQVNTIAEKHI
jgi:nicotinamide-nucleotide amidase